MIVYAVVDVALSRDYPLGDSHEVFIRRERTMIPVATTIPRLSLQTAWLSRSMEAVGIEPAKDFQSPREGIVPCPSVRECTVTERA